MDSSRTIAESPVVDVVIIVVSARNPAGFERAKESLARVAEEAGKPVVAWSYSVAHPESVRVLARAGLPLYMSLRGVARAVAAMAEYREALAR